MTDYRYCSRCLRVCSCYHSPRLDVVVVVVVVVVAAAAADAAAGVPHSPWPGTCLRR